MQFLADANVAWLRLITAAVDVGDDTIRALDNVDAQLR